MGGLAHVSRRDNVGIKRQFYILIPTLSLQNLRLLRLRLNTQNLKVPEIETDVTRSVRTVRAMVRRVGISNTGTLDSSQNRRRYE